MDNIELLDQKEKKMLIQEGQALLQLITSKGYTPYSFSKKALDFSINTCYNPSV